MANGKRDDNWVPVSMGISSSDGVTPTPLTVDPVTGRLRCVMASSDGGDGTPDGNPPNRDDNGVPAIAAETNNVARTVTPLSSHNGALMVQGS
jgi:hypothetical protein